MTLVAISGLALLGNALIYAGFALINARLFPAALGPVYASTSTLVRILAMEVLFAVPANAVFALIFRITTPAPASIAILASLVVVMAGNAVLLGNPISPRMLAALAATLAACAWFAYETARLTP